MSALMSCEDVQVFLLAHITQLFVPKLQMKITCTTRDSYFMNFMFDLNVMNGCMQSSINCAEKIPIDCGPLSG